MGNLLSRRAKISCMAITGVLVWLTRYLLIGIIIAFEGGVIR